MKTIKLEGKENDMILFLAVLKEVAEDLNLP